MTQLYIGLISGTSIDSVDAALIDCGEPSNQQAPALITTHSHAIPSALHQQITALCTPSLTINEIDLLGKTDTALGELFADAALTLLKKSGKSPQDITAIGSHGQTVRHRPPGEQAAKSTQPFTLQNANGFTLQIADPNIIAERTGITTVADFRRRDMACGGQGAPFAPAFHQAISPNDMACCAFLNLGGIANITIIKHGQLVRGYDTGPANGLMDAWIQQQQNLPLDNNGDWAAGGTVSHALLNALLADPYFSLPAPKSTGREAFNLDWLRGQSADFLSTLLPQDMQATLMALTVKSVGDELVKYQPQAVYCCGGGIHNNALMAQLNAYIEHRSKQASTPNSEAVKISSTEELGIAPDWVEAAAFAWLAKKHINSETVDLTAVTGANKASVLGVRTAC